VVTLVVSWATLIPFIGWLFGWLAPLLIVVAGLGGVLITRFGTQTYPDPVSGFGPSTPTIGPRSTPQPPVPPMPAAPIGQPEPPATELIIPDAMDAKIADLTPDTTASDAVIPDLDPAEKPVNDQTISPDRGTGTTA
jgi:hypothetical protein